MEKGMEFDPLITLAELETLTDKKMLEERFRHLCGAVEEECRTAMHQAVLTLQEMGETTYRFNIVIDISAGMWRFTLEDSLTPDADWFFTFGAAHMEVFDALCERLEHVPRQEAAACITAAANRLDKENVFDDVMEDFLEINGSYDFYGDIPGLFFKRKKKKVVARYDPSIPSHMGENPALCRYILQEYLKSDKKPPGAEIIHQLLEEMEGEPPPTIKKVGPLFILIFQAGSISEKVGAPVVITINPVTSQLYTAVDGKNLGGGYSEKFAAFLAAIPTGS